MSTLNDSAGGEPLILASASPRRRDLLTSAGLTFGIEPADVNEDLLPGEAPAAYVRRLAAAKARHVRARRAGTIIAADTTVTIDGAILAKPADRADAAGMLMRLSDREHQVITGFCVISAGGEEHRQEITTGVLFKRLHRDELEAYLDTGEWTDKAGGYGIQGHAAFMVARISGSYTNVVGLPLCETLEALRRVGHLRGHQ